MSCDCVERVNSHLALTNSRLGTAIIFGAGHLVPVIQTEVIEKKRGARAPVMLPTYCPFCGQPYKGEAAT